jgi:hypothetical protein
MHDCGQKPGAGAGEPGSAAKTWQAENMMAEKRMMIRQQSSTAGYL